MCCVLLLRFYYLSVASKSTANLFFFFCSMLKGSLSGLCLVVSGQWDYYQWPLTVEKVYILLNGGTWLLHEYEHEALIIYQLLKLHLTRLLSGNGFTSWLQHLYFVAPGLKFALNVVLWHALSSFHCVNLTITTSNYPVFFLRHMK